MVTSLLAAVLLAPAAASAPDRAAERPEETDLRSLPSLVARWECHCRAQGMTLAGDAVVVQEYRRLFALGAETHELLWDRKLEEASGFPRGPLALPGRIAATWGDRLLLVDAATGVEIADLTFDGRVEHLAGPPLAVVVRRPAEGEGSGSFVDEMVRIDAESGVVIARREVPAHDLVGVPAAAGSPSRLLVIGYGPREAPPEEREGRLLELSAEDLSTLRSWPGATGHFIPYDRADADRLLVPFGYRDGATIVRPYDLASGELGEPLPPRPQDGRFLHDLDLELQATAGSDPAEPQAVRRIDPATGDVLWETEIPGRPGGWVRERGLLHLHTRPFERGRGLLLTLDLATGAVQRMAYGLREVGTIERWGDLLILASGDGIVAVDADELGPPEREIRPVEAEVDRILERLARSHMPFAEPGADQDLLALGEEALPLLAARFEKLPIGSAEVVASVFGQAAYQPAAPLVARRLAIESGSFPGESAEASRHRTEHALLRALGRIGGAEEIDEVAAVLLDDERPLPVRERAAFALAEMGAEAGLAEVLPWLDRFYRRRAVADRKERSEGAGPAPADAEPRSEEDHIRLAIVRHWAAFKGERNEGPLCVVSERALEWPAGGAGRKVLTLPPEEKREDCHRLEARPATEEELAEHQRRQRELSPGERLWILNESSGGWAAQASWVVVRRVGDRWLVRDLSLWWIT